MKNKLLKVLLPIFTLALVVSCAPSVCTVYLKDTTDDKEYVKEIKVNNGSPLPEMEMPVRTGYTFKTWYYNGKDWLPDTPITNDIALHAIWNANVYPIAYSLPEGVINNMYNPTFHTYGLVAGLLPPISVPAGHRFKCWMENGKVVEQIDEFDTSAHLLECILETY